jgi:o-aminophenol oxidase
MPVKATIDEIRKCLVFTDGMRPPVIQRLELDPSVEISIAVRMRNANLKLHKDLHPTALWAYGGHYPGTIFFVRHDQTIAVEWINEIDGMLPFSVVACGYWSLDPAFVFPENEPGAFDGGKGPANVPTQTPPNRVRTPCQEDPNAKALAAWAVVHLHGARVAPDSDGWTENAFLSRALQTASQRSLYPPQPRSMMLWYHDHAYTITRLNVFAGLAGGWIIRGSEERGLNLPANGFEVPLIIQDRNFETDATGFLTGRLLHKAETDSTKFIPTNANPIPSDTGEFFGPFTLVNGSLWPSIDVKPQPYRYRVLNGSNARTYQLFLIDDTGTIRNDLVRQIGTDAGLLGNAIAIDTLQYPASDPTFQNKNKPKGLILAPAERADLIVDFQRAPGQTFRWINLGAAAYDGVPAIDPTVKWDVTNQGQASTLINARVPFPEVMKFTVENGPVGKPLDLSGLPKLQRWTHNSPELKGHNHRWLALNEQLKGPDLKDGFLFFNELIELQKDDPRNEDFSITLAEDSTTHRFLNRQVFFRSPINFYPVANKPEVWHIVNFSTDSHPIHLHLVDFQILPRYFYTVAGATDPIIVDATDPATGLFPDPNRPTFHAIIPDPARPNDATNPDGVDANEAGWKDVVRVNPNEIVTIAMIFEGFTGRFMYHCHILEHEDMDMMRPMVVVPSTVKNYIAEMQMMAGDEPDQPGMIGMPGM